MIYRLKELKGDTIAVPQLVFSKLGIAEEYNVRVALYVLATGVTDPDKLCADLKLRSRISAESALSFWAGAGLLERYEENAAPGEELSAPAPMTWAEIAAASRTDPMISSLIDCAQTGFAKYINDLSDRIFCLVRPFGHFHNRFVSGFTTFQLFFRDKDVIGKCAVFRHQKSIRLGYFQCTDKCIVGTLQYFYYFPFGILVFTFGVEGDLYFVIVHGMCRIAFGNKDRIASTFGDK